jgi:anaerobic ribonucleoside-triphosphate reductase activating protein
MDGRMNDPWDQGGLPFLNIAATVAATHALGPGLRAVVWVQGCCFNCPGCISPEWIPKQLARLVRPEDQAVELLARQDIDGLTFSGGEPMLQAAGLARLVQTARQQRELSVISFSGFTLEQLRQKQDKMPGVAEFLGEIDVLIDGLYQAGQNDNQGMRGSANQRIHYLSGRLSDYDFDNQARQSEIHIGDGYAFLVGVPATQVLASFNQAMEKAKKRKAERHPHPPAPSPTPAGAPGGCETEEGEESPI